MKKHFNKIHKAVTELAVIVTAKKCEEFTEDDLEILATSMDILSDLYDELYNNVFEESEFDNKIVYKGTKDQL